MRNPVMAVVALIVGVIAIVAVGVPIVKDVVTAANLTGIEGTIATYFSTFLMLGGLVYIVSTLF